MSRSKITISVLAPLLLLAFGGGAYGTISQFAISSSAQPVVFQWISGSLDVALGTCTNMSTFTGTCTLTGNGLDETGGSPVAGTYSITTTTGGSAISLGNPTNGVFPIHLNGATSIFSFTDPNGTFTATLNFTNVNDGSPNPHFDGTSSFDPNATFDFILATLTPSGSTVDALWTAGNGSASAPISSGEFPTPEPGSMLLFGSGLLGLGTFLRRRFSA